MDNKKEKKDIVITGNIFVKIACSIGLVAIAFNTILNLLNKTEVNLIMLIAMGFACIMGIVLAGKKS